MSKECVLFLDETGLLNANRDKFFGLGIIKTEKPQDLYLPIKQIRDKFAFYDEIKWSSVSKKNNQVVQKIIEVFINEPSSSFSCIFLDKRHLDFEHYFHNDFWKVYESFTYHLLRASIKKSESCVLLADYYPAPADTNFEKNVKYRLNSKFERLAIHSVCRLDSKSSDLLQLCDYILGAISYEYKLENKLVISPSKLKIEALKHLKNNLGVKSFMGNYKSSKMTCMLFSGSKKKILDNG